MHSLRIVVCLSFAVACGIAACSSTVLDTGTGGGGNGGGVGGAVGGDDPTRVERVDRALCASASTCCASA